MNWWVVIAVGILVVVGFLAFRLGWVDLSDKTRRRSSSSGSSIVGIGDEVFAPTRHEAQIEMDRQSILPAPAPVAGDRDLGIFDGRITIDVANLGGATGRPAPTTTTERRAGRHVSESAATDSRDA